MAEKLDLWGKLNLLNTFLGSIVLVAIPIAIQFGASKIAQSLETGRMIQQMTTDLANKAEQNRQDIALVALDAAIEPEQRCKFFRPWQCDNYADEHDQVVGIAVIILKDLQGDSEQAKAIIRHRMPSEAAETLITQTVEKERDKVTSNPNPNQEVSPEQADQRAQAAEIAANTLAPETNTPDIRIVYIQYRTDATKAKAIQNYLQGQSQYQGITVPAIEQVNGISENSIRYANPAARSVAEDLQQKLESNLQVEFPTLIDLSDSQYRVPDGQFEIWLKD